MCHAAATRNKKERVNNQLLTENVRLAKRTLGCSLWRRARAALDSLTREFGFLRLATGFGPPVAINFGPPFGVIGFAFPVHSREGVPGKGRRLSPFPGPVITKPSSSFLPPTSAGSDTSRCRSR
jgi:hypothetical protein